MTHPPGISLLEEEKHCVWTYADIDVDESAPRLEKTHPPNSDGLFVPWGSGNKAARLEANTTDLLSSGSGPRSPKVRSSAQPQQLRRTGPLAVSALRVASLLREGLRSLPPPA